MAKKLTRSKLVKKLDTIFSQYIRHGHFQSRRHYSTRWDEINCQVQCAGCNVFKYGEQYVFGNKLDQKFGSGTASRLHIKAQKTIKYSDTDLVDMIKRYKNFVDCF